MIDPDESDASVSPLEDNATTPSQALLMFVGSLATLVTCVGGVGYIFWRSDQEYGGLPSPNGPGLILYGGVAIGVAIVIAFAVWGYLQWRGSKHRNNL